MATKDTSPCRGCREDFYNHDGAGIALGGCCASLKGAKLVRRWRLDWWTAPTVPRAFVEVETYDCHREPGRFAFSKSLPGFAIDPVRLKTKEVA